MSHAEPMSFRAHAPIVPVTARGAATRRKLLSAAELEFGDKGFHSASVSSITLRAGVGQGTFYLYFRTKEEIFVTLVQEIGRALRQHSAETLARCAGSAETERACVDSFIEFAKRHPGRLRIVQEAQFVDEPVFRDYYASLAATYGKSLSRARGGADSEPGEASAWAIMGIGHFIAMRYCLWQGQPPEAPMLAQAMRLLSHSTPAMN
ncbi:MAG: TetR/AcrR family transcriptional regulator [Stenotrophobium sp.]